MTKAPSSASLHPLLQQAATLMAQQDRAGAVALLERLAAASDAPSAARFLTQAALWLQRTDPTRSISLLEQALALDASLTLAWLALGNLHERAGQMFQAAKAAQEVIGGQAPAQERLDAANLLMRCHPNEAALLAACAAYDELGRPLAQAGALLGMALRSAAWQVADPLVAQLRAAYAAGDFSGANESPRDHLLWCGDEATNVAVVRQWSQRYLPAVSLKPLAVPQSLDGRRLRVGYLSSDFRNHPTAWLLNGLFRHHDRKKVELVAYCSSWDDGSAIRKEVLSHFGAVHSVAQMSDAAAADLMRSHRLDVLVDLSGPTRLQRMGILAHRVAPVQVSQMGFPGSAGGRSVDYIVADEYTLPAEQEHLFPEKVLRITPTYFVSDYLARHLPAAPTRAQAGLPATGRVAGVFNAIDKVGSDVWATWMQVLLQSPGTVLWVLDPGEAARRHLMQSAARVGVAVRQILFAPKQSQETHLARLQCCDLMLDPWPYGGHTTTLDALFAHVPVVALKGSNWASRVSGALLHAAGVPTLVQPDRAAYVDLAVRLLNHATELDQIKQRLKQTLCDTELFNVAGQARQLEDIYFNLVRKHAERHNALA